MQPAKVLSHINSTLFGILTVFNDLQPIKVPESDFVCLLNLTLLRFLHPLKTPPINSLTEFGITIDFNDVQPLKANYFFNRCS